MKRAVGIFLLAAFTAGFLAASAFVLVLPDRKIRPGSPIGEYTAFLDARIPGLMRQYGIPGVSIALVKDGQVVCTAAYGYADLESGRKLTMDMPMRVQSISKSVTAWAVLKLAEEGKLSLNGPVEKYLEGWKLPASDYPKDGVTIRRLLCHTAGLPLGDVFALYSPEEPVPSLEESLSGSASLFQMPGKGFSYSNVGYNLLELLIEKVTGRDFAEYMKNEVLEPLGMYHSDFEWSDAALKSAPLGYTLNGKPVSPYRYPERASGGLIATTEDIARFCIAGMPDFSGQRVLARASVERLYSVQAERLGVYGVVFDAYGYGYYTERLSDGKLAVSHGGQGTGWMSHFHAVPETGDAIVILTNSQRSWPFIACVLKGWAQWRGFSSPGMTRILLGECAMWGLCGLVCAAAVIEALHLGRCLKSGGAALAFARGNRIKIRRGKVFGISLAMIGGLLWCVSQRYIFLTSVFPAASEWLGLSAAVFAAMLFLLSFFPK